jgi:hypothetical protein
MQHPQNLKPQETQSLKDQKSPLIFTQICPKAPNPKKKKLKNTKKPELHLKGKPKIQIKPQIQKKSHSYSQEKEKKLKSVARGTTVAGAALNQQDKLSNVAESARKASEGVRAGQKGPQHRRYNSQTSKNSIGHTSTHSSANDWESRTMTMKPPVKHVHR